MLYYLNTLYSISGRPPKPSASEIYYSVALLSGSPRSAHGFMERLAQQPTQKFLFNYCESAS